MWNRTEFGTGRRTQIASEEIASLAISEGCNARMATGRVAAGKAFASPVASYEPHARAIGAGSGWKPNRGRPDNRLRRPGGY